MKRTILLILLMFFGSVAFGAPFGAPCITDADQAEAALPPYPDPKLTPGLIDPACTVEAVCKPGYTATVRPPESYTQKIKLKQMKALHLPGSPKDYELDHLISLELCGHPTDERNLWMEPYAGEYGAHEKDFVENYLHKKVCARQMPIDLAVNLIIHNWVDVYNGMKKGTFNITDWEP